MTPDFGLVLYIVIFFLFGFVCFGMGLCVSFRTQVEALQKMMNQQTFRQREQLELLPEEDVHHTTVQMNSSSSNGAVRSSENGNRSVRSRKNGVPDVHQQQQNYQHLANNLTVPVYLQPTLQQGSQSQHSSYAYSSPVYNNNYRFGYNNNNTIQPSVNNVIVPQQQSVLLPTMTTTDAILQNTFHDNDTSKFSKHPQQKEDVEEEVTL